MLFSRKEMQEWKYPPICSPINVRRDAPQLKLDLSTIHSNFKTMSEKSKSNLQSSIFNFQSQLGINRKKFNFTNTTSSKVVPIDFIDDQSLEYGSESIRLNENLKPSLVDKKLDTQQTSNNFDILPTIRILNDSNDSHNVSNSSGDKSVQMIEKENSNSRTPNVAKRENKHTTKRRTHCKIQYNVSLRKNMMHSKMKIKIL